MSHITLEGTQSLNRPGSSSENYQRFLSSGTVLTSDREDIKMKQVTINTPQPLVEVNRLLTPNEYRFLNAPNSNISLVVRVSGEVTAAQFQNAVHKARLKHPMLGVKIQYDAFHQGWFVNEDVPANPIRVVQRDDDHQWLSELRKEHQSYLDLTRNPLIRFVLLIGEGAADFIIFANHATCDGLSLSYLARDIVYFLAHPEDEVVVPIVPVPMDDDHTTVSLKSGRLVNAIMNNMNQKWQANPVYFHPEEFQSLHTAFWRDLSYNLVDVQLSETETYELVQACRAHDITVNTALCAAFNGAAHALHAKHEKYLDMLGIAVDIRDKMRIEQKDFFGFSASGIAPRFCYNLKQDFWANAQKLHSQIQRQLKKEFYVKNLIQKTVIPHTISDAMQVAVIGGMLRPDDQNYERISGFRQDSKNVVIKMLKKRGVLDGEEKQLGVLCTNLGRAKFSASFGAYQIQAMQFTPSSGLLMECVLGVITVGGKLNLTVGNMMRRDATEELEKLTELALGFLM
jgi:NRPS condensation-like uncharacterized protein